MVLKIAISEAHNEILNSSNSLKLQDIIKEHNFEVNFIKEYLTSNLLSSYHVLIIGGPTEPLDYSEIVAIEKFVKQEGFLILMSVAGGELSGNNLSELSRRFEFEFNPDFVEDYKHNLNNNPRLPIIHHIKKSFPFTKSINKIIFTGCSISILDESVKGFIYTDRDSIPSMTALGVISTESNVIGFSSSSIFNDTLLEKYNNKKLIDNILRYISTIFKKREKEIKDKYKKISPSKAVRLLEHLISLNTKKLKEIDGIIDNMYNRILGQISKVPIIKVKENLNKNYKLILQKIDSIAAEINNQHAEFSFLGNEYQTEAVDVLNRWYASEAEIREKLDMIRNNLLSRINTE
ncbi:MAG: hypothetical protein ACTSRP_16535 [Candidatus Helarchaeota archaeon]